MSSGTTHDDAGRFFLTPQQQSLLFAALNSNKTVPAPTQSVANKGMTMTPDSYQSSPVIDGGAVDNSFLPNYDYGDFGDTSFDFSFADDSQASMIGELPGSSVIKSEPSENDSSDKRAHPDDEDDDEDVGSDPKRRESTDKAPKKPGRKPLTSEPTSKRKAQNRAAQRAFRERKEKHLKDLETKVDELQKASEAANNENELLRRQVGKMTSELNEYKTRFSLMRNRSTSASTPRLGFGAPAVGNLNDVNFQFEFPKFGVLPGPQTANKPSPPKPASNGSPLASLGGSKPLSPAQSNPRSKENSISPVMSNNNFNLSKEDMANFSTFFDPSLARASMSTSRASLDSGPHSMHNGTSTSSPSASSQSNGGGPSSSCGTSPEPFTQSPMGFKPVDTMTTIGEEHSGMGTNQNVNLFGGMNTNSFDWLAQQNGGNFDPQLFGDYREPQENILSTNTFDDTFFNEAFDNDFFFPYNVAPSPNMAKKTPHANLIDQIDAAKNNVDDFTPVVPDGKPQVNCNQVFASLANCPKVQSGEFDLDGLCSELQKKAKCSGEGPTVSEVDFQTVVNKWMGKDTADCITASLSGNKGSA